MLPTEQLLTTGEVLLDCNARAAAGFANRYKTSDRSELALRLNAMLTSQKNSRGSSNQSSHTKKKPLFRVAFLLVGAESLLR